MLFYFEQEVGQEVSIKVRPCSYSVRNQREKLFVEAGSDFTFHDYLLKKKYL